ncbi:MAG: rhomboid family intramembrane serine protease [Bacteroidetes bacterium]|nr:rhomboid family intramembrane serine protease [Bacteroidota bacterium]
MLTIIIIAITSIVSIIAFQRHDIFQKLQFNPYAVKHNNEWSRFLLHAFLHADWMHLIFNMLVLFFFGGHIENAFEYHFGARGILYFIMLYIGGILFSSLTTYKKHQDNIYYNSVGASGAVSAVLFSFVVIFPVEPICLWGVLCLPGLIWGIIYLVYSYTMAKKASDNINHDAHFMGALFGIAFTIAIRPTFAVEFYQQILMYLDRFF